MASLSESLLSLSPGAGTHTAPCRSSSVLEACLLEKTGKAALGRGTCSTAKEKRMCSVPETPGWHVCRAPTHCLVHTHLTKTRLKLQSNSVGLVKLCCFCLFVVSKDRVFLCNGLGCYGTCFVNPGWS